MGGGEPTPQFVAKTYHLARFLPKLHENEGNWTEKGCQASLAPLGSANEYNNILKFTPISLDVKKFNHHNSLESNELTPTGRIFTSVTQQRIGRERVVRRHYVQICHLPDCH